jgi:hypothetical protein
MSYITNREWISEVMLGNVAGFSGAKARGSASVGTSAQPIWGVTDAITDNVTLLGSADTVFVASTDANDTSAGTGARTVKVDGLNASGVAATETITLAGQTAVESVATWVAVNRLEVLTAGSGGLNAGVIWCGDGTFTAGVPATKYRMMEVGMNLDHTFLYTVPAAKTAYPYDVLLTIADTAKFVTTQFYRQTGAGLRYLIGTNDAGPGSLASRLYFSDGIAAQTMIWATAMVSTSAAQVSLSLDLLLKDD